MADVGNLAGVTTNRWSSQLSVDSRRSALEIFRNMRAVGCVTVCDWIAQNCSRDKRSDVWIDLWTIASSSDFRVAEASQRGDATVINLLNSDDTIELGFRRLAAYIHEDRPGDHVAGMRMLGVPAPGSKSDVAPNWLLEESGLASKFEHQRDVRVRSRRKGDGRKNGKDDSGPGKPGGRKGKRE
jgi:hypothetical protein